MQGCVCEAVGWMGGILWRYCGVVREGVQGAFVGHGEEGGGCWSLQPPGADKTPHLAAHVSAELRLGWVRPSWIWAEKVNIYLGLFLTVLVQRGPNEWIDMAY